MIFYLQPNHYVSPMQQKWLTMPQYCLGSSNWNTPSKCFVLVSTTRQRTPQDHQHTAYCTAGVIKMKVSFSIQIQTRFPDTIATPKKQGAGASLCRPVIQARPNHKVGGSSYALIGPQSGFSDYSHICSYPKLKMATPPYQCFPETFPP